MGFGCGKMTQRLRALAALAEDHVHSQHPRVASKPSASPESGGTRPHVVHRDRMVCRLAVLALKRSV